MKALRKLLYYTIVIVASVLAGGVLAVYIYKDNIIELLKVEINKSLKTQLEVEAIDVSFFKGFPNLTIVFKGVNFHSDFDNQSLLEAEQVSFVLNSGNLLNEKIIIEQVVIEKGKIIVHKDLQGNSNYNVFVMAQSLDDTVGTIKVNSILLTNVSVAYTNEPIDVNMSIYISKFLGSVSVESKLIELYGQSNFKIDNASMNYTKWLIGKNVMIKTKGLYNEKSVSIFPSEIKIDNAQFKFDGKLSLLDEIGILFNIDGEKNKFYDIVSLLPNHLKEKLAPYNGKGTIGVSAKLNGRFAKYSLPAFNASFKINDFEISHEQLLDPLHSINLEGDLFIKDLAKLETGNFLLKNASANVKDHRIEITGSISNFIDPHILVHTNGDLDVTWLLNSIQKMDSSTSGSIGIRLDLDIKKEQEIWKANKSNFKGDFVLSEVGFAVNPDFQVEHINGRFSVLDNSVEIEELSGNLGSSEINVNGIIQNVFNLFENDSTRQLNASLNLKSNRLMVDELVNEIINSTTDSINAKTKPPENFNLDIDVLIEKLNFRRFVGSDINAKLTITPSRFVISKLTAAGLGGKVAISGNVSRMFNDDYFIKTDVRTKAIELDSLFYVFYNFNQDFITTSDLKGLLSSKINAYMYFDKDWRLKRNLLFTDGQLTINNGELIDFKPIMALSTYFKNEKEKLSRLKFSDINSSIKINRDTIFISDMYIKTNVRNIKVGGYHTLKQHINYRLSVPVINDKQDKDLQFGEVRSDKNGGLYWPFRIKGTTENYKVTYDLATASANFVKGFRNKSKELEKAAVIDSLKLNSDEYFDWDQKKYP